MDFETIHESKHMFNKWQTSFCFDTIRDFDYYLMWISEAYNDFSCPLFVILMDSLIRALEF